MTKIKKSDKVAQKFHALKDSQKYSGVRLEVLYDHLGLPVAMHTESLDSMLVESPPAFAALALATSTRMLARSIGIPFDKWIAAIREVEQALDAEDEDIVMESSTFGGPLPH